MAIALISALLLLAAVQPSTAQTNTKFDFSFDSSLDGMTSNRGIWNWKDRASLEWKVPDGRDGFAVYDQAGEGDELFSAFIPLEYGLNYSMVYFTNSKYYQGTTLQLHKLALGGHYLQTITDLSSLSSPLNDEWMFVSGYVEPEANALVSRFFTFIDLYVNLKYKFVRRLTGLVNQFISNLAINVIER